MIITGYIDLGKLEKKVCKKLKDLGIKKEDYPIDPYKLIKAEGIILQEVPLDNNNIKGMMVSGDNATGILINANRSFTSRRFIAMHELCHYWFHPKQTKTICLEDYPRAKQGIEWQANNAAALALMPTPVLDDLYRTYGYDPYIISDILKVSLDSFSIRTRDIYLDYKKQENIRYSRLFKEDVKFTSLENNWLYGGL